MTSSPKDRALHDRPRAATSARPDSAPPANDPARGNAASPSDAPGRIVFDRRGNPVWEWSSEEGDSTSVLLRKLDNDALALEPTRRTPALGKGKAAGKAAPGDKGLELAGDDGGGFNPYDRS